MCGRYALAFVGACHSHAETPANRLKRPSDVRRQLQTSGMPVDEAPDDDATRQSYNVAPGYFEPVYRADVPDRGAESGGQHEDATGATKSQEDRPEGQPETAAKGPRYKLQAMKWGWSRRDEGLAAPGSDPGCDRADTVLDKAQSGLRLDDEDHQLPR